MSNKKIKTDEFLNIIAFISLSMDSGFNPPLNSPDYILEKYIRYINNDKSAYNWGLDSSRRKYIINYLSRWNKQIKSIVSDPDRLDKTKPMTDLIIEKLSEEKKEKEDDLPF